MDIAVARYVRTSFPHKTLITKDFQSVLLFTAIADLKVLSKQMLTPSLFLIMRSQLEVN
jgi:hypothetical protein